MSDEVTESQLQLLLGEGRDPVTGDPLGRAYAVSRSVADRMREHAAKLDLKLGPASRAKG